MSDSKAEATALLRKVADYIDGLGTVDVLDITFAAYWDGDHEQATMSVYYAPLNE